MTKDELIRGLPDAKISGPGYWYLGGRGGVVLVAHIDTVHRDDIRRKVRFRDGIYTGPNGLGADDRAGVWASLVLRERFGCPVLLLDYEECGGIGARCAAGCNKIKSASKSWSLMIEIDRRGRMEYVEYSLQPTWVHRLMRSVGFELHRGSFSDIAVLGPALNVPAVNVSAGYYLEHTKSEILIVDDLFRTMKSLSAILRGEVGVKRSDSSPC
jgi:hypothetical protein